MLLWICKIRKHACRLLDDCIRRVLDASEIMKGVIKGGVAQWVARLIRNVEVVGSSPINGPP